MERVRLGKETAQKAFVEGQCGLGLGGVSSQAAAFPFPHYHSPWVWGCG